MHEAAPAMGGFEIVRTTGPLIQGKCGKRCVRWGVGGSAVDSEDVAPFAGVPKYVKKKNEVTNQYMVDLASRNR